MNSPLALKISTNISLLPIINEPHLIYLLVEVCGGENAHKLPMNLGLAIDISASMRIRMVTEEQFINLVGHGNTREILTDGIPAWEIEHALDERVINYPRKIDYVSEALKTVRDHIQGSDTFSLIGFASRAHLLIPTTPGSQRDLLIDRGRELDQIHLGDETSIAGGLLLAYQEIREHGLPRRDNRIILLTDGHTRDIKACYAWARRARARGITITTMGVGTEFNEDLLIPIAEITGGNAYYIERPEQIPAAFQQELGTALRTRYRNLKLNIGTSSGVRLRQIYRVIPELGYVEMERLDSQTQTAFLGSYDPSVSPAFLMEIISPPLQPGSHRLAMVDLSWIAEDETLQTAQPQAIIIQAGSSTDANQNQRVNEVVDKIGAFKLGNFALGQITDSTPIEAITRLRQAAKRLLQVNEPVLAAEITNLASVIQTQGQVEASATKKLRYETRRITQNSSC